MIVTTTLRLPEALHKVIKAEAEQKGIAVNALILQILWEVTGKSQFFMEERTNE